MKEYLKPRSALDHAVVAAALVLVLILSSRVNFLFVHSIAELFVIAIAGCTCAFAWSSRRFENGYVLALGLSCGYIAVLETLHMISYKGMGVFPEVGANLATQYWIASRYFLAVTFCVAPFFVRRPLAPRAVLAVGGVACAALIAAITTGVFPICYIEGPGLTDFKIVSEYVICVLFLAGLVGLLRFRSQFDREVLGLLVAFLGLSILSELMFTSYIGVYGAINLAGHIVMVLSFYFFYKAVVETGVRRPLELLYLEQLRAQERLQDLTAKLEKALHTRDEFFSIASHELKTPLTALGLQLEMALRQETRARETGNPGERPLIAGGPPRRDLQQQLTSARRHVQRLTQLVNDLLDVARIEAGRLRYAFEDEDLSQIIGQAAERLEVALRDAGCELKLEIEPGIHLQCDRGRIEQVVENLLGNCAKYARGASVTVSLKRLDDGALLAVRDTGPGIPSDQHAVVFERERIGSGGGAATHGAGLGLGLFLVKQIVQAHRGTVDLRSDEGQGAEFLLRLPAIAE